jgi:hypothetical protein
MIRKLLAAAAGVLSLSFAGAASAATVVPVTPDFVYDDGFAFPYADIGSVPDPHGSRFVLLTWDKGEIDDLSLYIESEVTWGKVDSTDPWGVAYNESYHFDYCTLAAGCLKQIGERKAYARIYFPPEWDLPCVGADGFQCYQRVNYTSISTYFRVRGTPGDLIGGTMTLTDISPVPEPATWAMMIMGFSLAGAALRRRQAA